MMLFGLDNGVHPNKRMKDAQFMSELLLVLIEKSMRGFDQEALDTAYARYDDLDELEEPLDTEEIAQKLADGKQYVMAMQSNNGSVKQYASQLAAFYTLWSAVVLHRFELPDPGVFAGIFAEFRGRVEELEQAIDKTQFLLGPSAALYRRPSEFLEAYRGASTDLAPRTKRLDALLNYVRERPA